MNHVRERVPEVVSIVANRLVEIQRFSQILNVSSAKMGNGAKAAQKRERNAKDGKKEASSQLKSVRLFELLLPSYIIVFQQINSLLVVRDKAVQDTSHYIYNYLAFVPLIHLI